jgi:hypothetical protein
MFDYSNAIDNKFGNYIIKDDIIIMPYWTEKFCNVLLDYCKENKNKFSVDPNPRYKSEELLLYEFDEKLLKEYSNHYKECLIPILEKEWDVSTISGLMSPYIIRYDKDSIKKGMIKHSDCSVFTVHIKLNSDYGEGSLHFPRQKFKITDVPVGHGVIWPGALTHPHYADDITWGEKYSFVSFNFHDCWHPSWENSKRYGKNIQYF